MLFRNSSSTAEIALFAVELRDCAERVKAAGLASETRFGGLLSEQRAATTRLISRASKLPDTVYGQTCQPGLRSSIANSSSFCSRSVFD
jgi:hypothetical protein